MAAAGLPAVVTDVKGHSDLVAPEENGYLFPYDDAAAFAAAVAPLTASPQLRQRMGAAGKEKMRPYALDAVLPQVMEQYLSVMDGGYER